MSTALAIPRKLPTSCTQLKAPAGFVVILKHCLFSGKMLLRVF